MTLPCVVRIAELEAELAAERARTDALVIAMNAGCSGDAYWKAVFAAKSEIEKARSLMIPTQPERQPR